MNSLVAATQSRRRAEAGAVEIISKSFRVLWIKRSQLSHAVLVPAVLVAILLGVTVESFYSLLGTFLVAPSAKRAGVIFAVLVAGGLGLLFLSTQIVLVGASVNCKSAPTRRFGLCAGATDARLFLAMLSLALSISVLVAGIMLLRTETPPVVLAFMVYAGSAIVIGLFVRVGFLLPALALVDRGMLLNRSWHATRGRFWSLGFAWAMLFVVPMVAIFVFGELLIQNWVAVGLSHIRSPAQISLALATHGAGVLIALLLTAALIPSLMLAGIGSTIALELDPDHI